MCIDLPAGQRILGRILLDRDVSIAPRPVRLRLPHQKDVFRRADTLRAAVLQHLGVAEPIGLVVLPHDVGDDGHHTHELEAVLQVVKQTLGMERADRRHALAGNVAE